MPLVFGAIVPHGFSIIPTMSEDAGGAQATRSAMEEMGRRFTRAQPDAVVLAGPHGVRVARRICLSGAGRAAGTLQWEGKRVELNIPLDSTLATEIADAAEIRGVPTALAAWGGNRTAQSSFPLEWGTITPLWFLGHQHVPGSGDVLADAPERDVAPPVVLVTPSRDLPREAMIAFGEAVGEVAARSERRIAILASCDWAHTLHDDGPYGFHPTAQRVDEMVAAAIQADDLKSLLRLSEEDVQDAAIDGLWQTLMLHGARRYGELRAEFLSYEAPSYFGMIVATYEMPT